MVGSVAVGVLLGLAVSPRAVSAPVAVGLTAAIVIALAVLIQPEAMAGKRPSFLVVRKGAFVAPADLGELLAVAAFTISAGAYYGYTIGHDMWHGQEIVAFFILTSAAALTPHWWQAARSGLLFVRPDGVLIRRRQEGSLFVPWEAGPSGVSASKRNDEIALLCRRPDLAHLVGKWADGPVILATADVRFLARVIDEYAAHPEHRAAIGTPAELDRLTRRTNARNAPGPDRGPARSR
ncbi:hypothetical protein Ate02nite_29590 [Paractinoplanes tereljensis]|uniref:PH domain-containing protein n=2 Tax=Paractinoplanes tereljensis TaxID=571912 RepID=A0A919NK54_9ACTN|nr:hypothetical protein Ate02nite_29590 [Actinoplanes tereljensis]